jgi:hypothetical protein
MRDVLLTGTGLWLIISQIGARDPSSTLIVAGLALTVPAAATHAAGVLSGPSVPSGPTSSSPSSPPPGEPGSSPSRPDGGSGGEAG